MLAAALAAGPAWSQGNGSDDNLSPESEVPEISADELGQSLEAGRVAVARQVDNAATYIDSFFGDERYEAEIRQSRLRLGSSVLPESGEGVSLDADVDLRLVLPNTEKRLSLVIGAALRDDQDTIDERISPDLPRSDDDERRLAADLRYAVLDDLEEHLDAILGFRFSEFVPALAFGLRYRRSWEPNDWTVRMTHEGEWETKDGFEAKSFVDLETILSPRYFLRATPEILWQEKEEGLEYGVGFSLTQELTETRLLQYVLGYRFATEPDHQLETILLRTRYRQSVFDDRARFEIAPQLRLADADGFDGKPGILFRFEVLF